MPARKIVNEQEVLDWFEEGKSYAEMSEIYLRKYNIETVASLWGNFRRRRGLTRRIARNDDLIPWMVSKHHETAYALAMLRVEARRLDGLPLRDSDASRLDSWKQMLKEEGDLVVHYDPDSIDGFYYTPRGPRDLGLIHEPAKKTRQALRAD